MIDELKSEEEKKKARIQRQAEERASEEGVESAQQ